jgi:predicted ester cyclase
MGSFPPSGKVLDANYIAIYRIENSRIAEAWAEWDNLAGLKQLGHAT